jgi:hypothetical protein
LRKGRRRSAEYCVGGGIVTADSSLVWVYVAVAILVITGTTIFVAYHH